MLTLRAFLVPSDDRATVAGQSAGAMIVAGLLASPPTRGLFTRATTAALFGDATRRLADVHGRAGHGRTFSYEFTWRSNAFDSALGACHCLDLPFAFGTTDLSALQGPQALLGTVRPDPDQVRRVHDARVGFVRDGDPGWPQHTATAPHRVALP